MTKQLIMIRHAKSDWSLPAIDDFERPLAGRGIVDCAKIGQWLAAQGCSVDCVISSSALRAWQTTEAIAYSLGISRQKIQYDGKLYLADSDDMLKIIRKQADNCDTLLLVGHNPGMDQLLIELTAHKLKLTENGKLLTTASVAMLSIPDDWKNLATHSGNIIVMMRPREL